MTKPRIAVSILVLLLSVGCRVLLSGGGTGPVPPPAPDPPVPGPETPDTPDVPADLTSRVADALSGNSSDARKYAALFSVMAEEIRTTDRSLAQIRRDFPAAKTKRGLPVQGPLSAITAELFEPWSTGSEFTPQIREEFSAACETLAAACLAASR